MGGGGGKGQLRSSRLNNPVRQKSKWAFFLPLFIRVPRTFHKIIF